MKRREYLKYSGVAGAGALAGCLNGESRATHEIGEVAEESQRELQLTVSEVSIRRFGFHMPPNSTGSGTTTLTYHPSDVVLAVSYIQPDGRGLDDLSVRMELESYRFDGFTETRREGAEATIGRELEENEQVAFVSVPPALLESGEPKIIWDRLEEPSAVWTPELTFDFDSVNLSAAENATVELPDEVTIGGPSNGQVPIAIEMDNAGGEGPLPAFVRAQTNAGQRFVMESVSAGEGETVTWEGSINLQSFSDPSVLAEGQMSIFVSWGTQSNSYLIDIEEADVGPLE